jgi:hypothetical protein
LKLEITTSQPAYNGVDMWQGTGLENEDVLSPLRLSTHWEAVEYGYVPDLMEWNCSDGHTHKAQTANRRDSRSAGNLGLECITSGDRITGVNYPNEVARTWAASSRTERPGP